MIEKITVLMNTNEKLVLDSVSAFKVKYNNEDRLIGIVTNNELDQNGLVKLLVSEIKDGNFVHITDEELWNAAKNAMRAIISGSAYDFTYDTMPKEIKAEGEFFRIIAVQEAAKTQLISDYVAKRPVVTSPDTVPKKETLIDNPAIYPTENPEVKVADELSSGISYTEEKKDEEVAKPVNVLDNQPKEEKPAEPEVSMDELVEQALKTNAEPTNFSAEAPKVVDATKLMEELNKYIRDVVNDELSKK